MTEFIEITLKQAAVALAESQNFDRAAVTLGITSAEVKNRIRELEERLCLNLFMPEAETPTLTDEGRFLVQAFRKALARHE